MTKPLLNSLSFYSDEPSFFKAVDIFNIKKELYNEFDNFNIYFIAKASKIWFVPDSLKILEDNYFTFDVAIQNGYRHKLQQITSPYDKDVKKIYVSNFPHREILFEDCFGNVIKEFTSLDSIRMLPKKIVPNFEILYIGKSIGNKNKRNLLDRLTKDAHEKFLKICLDVNTYSPGMEVYIFGLKFEYTKKHLFSNSKFDYNSPELNIQKALQDEIEKVIPRKLKINLIEEALINYFKTTKYNQLLTSSLDKKNTKAYKTLKKAGISNLFVEFNMKESQINLFSEQGELFLDSLQFCKEFFISSSSVSWQK